MSVLDAVAADTITFNDLSDGNGGIKIDFYGSVNEAANWFGQRLYNRPWLKSTRRQQEAALAEATQLIDNLRYWGSKTDEDQNNEFPRNGLTVVPIAVRRATYEIALMLLDGYDVEKEITTLNVVASGYSSARIQYDRSSVQEHVRNGIPSFKAWELLVPYLADPQQMSIIRAS